MSKRIRKSLQVFGCAGLPLAFLCGVLYPVVSMVRENARSASCQSNLKRLGLALAQYSQDNDDTLPNASAADGRTWREVLLPYIKTKDAYHCPQRNDFADAHGFSQNYAANDCRKGAFAGAGAKPITRREYFEPSRLISLTETEHNPRPEFNIDDPVQFGPQTQKLWAGHFSVHSNFLFADGHARMLFPADTALFDPRNRSLFNFWYRSPDTQLSPNGEAVLKETAKQFRRK